MSKAVKKVGKKLGLAKEKPAPQEVEPEREIVKDRNQEDDIQRQRAGAVRLRRMSRRSLLFGGNLGMGNDGNGKSRLGP